MVLDLEVDVVSGRANLEIEGLVPHWGLASILMHSSLELLTLIYDFHVRVLLAEGLHIASESALHHVDVE